MKKTYGQMVIATNSIDMAMEILASKEEKTTVLDKHLSTFDEILDTVHMHGLAEYASKHGLFTTVVFEMEITDEDMRDTIEFMMDI